MAHKRKLNDAKFPEVTKKASKLEITEARKKAMTKNELMNKYNSLGLAEAESQCQNSASASFLLNLHSFALY